MPGQLDPKTLSTAELVAVAGGRGSQEEFGAAVAELLMRYRKLVYAQAFYHCAGDLSAADEVFQETFLRVFQYLRNRRGEPLLYSFAGLVRVFSKRAAIDLWRRQARATDASELRALEVNDQFAQRLDTALYVQQLLEEAEEIDRTILRMFYFEGLGSREIGQRLGLSASDVRQSKSRVIKQIRLQEAIDQAADLLEPVSQSDSLERP